MHADFHNADVQGVGGGVAIRPSPRVSKLRVVEFTEKNGELLSTSTRDWLCVFGPRSIFDPAMIGQRSNFRKIDNVSILH